ncbi:carbonic anhydrase-related protein 10-like [Penaeus japonicus]|uniref:carbonic anhydrase-related protein 10-like n=1 Tax=Penaeus japonicus TaxID=27405 RepID=UPI001C714036|nr:carbonic anhydrase-related protein 10-like [Penaeus japonicus]
MCERGRRQSPVNIEPSKLVYDPHLRHVHVDKHRVSGSLHNTGQSVIFRVEKGSKHHVNITGGPLVYKYRFQDLYIHFGAANHQGSEHQVNGAAFPAESDFEIDHNYKRVSCNRSQDQSLTSGERKGGEDSQQQWQMLHETLEEAHDEIL